MPPNDNLGEEPHTTVINGNRIAILFRTVVGHICMSYSNDAGRTWEDTIQAPYDPFRQPKQLLKNPRGPIQVGQFEYK